jgi:hypothetical protein
VALVAIGAVVVVMLLVDRNFFHTSSSPAGGGSGVSATQSRALPRFTGVDLAGDNNVVIQVGGRRSVVVHADSNLLGRVTTRVRSGRLVIGTTPGNLAAKTPMYVMVTLPSLTSLTLSGAGNISATGVDSHALDIALPGTGTIHATGSVRRLGVTISGEGTVALRGLVARDARATLSGDGSILLTATRRLKAELPGTGTIVYGGSPSQLTQHVTGTGTIVAG